MIETENESMQDESTIDSYCHKDNRDWFIHICEDLYGLTKSPKEMIRSALLAAMSMACQDLAQVDIPHMGIKPCSLYFLTLTQSGGRKSSVCNQVMKPFIELDMKRRKKFEEEKAKYDDDLKDWKDTLNYLNRQRRQAPFRVNSESNDDIEALIKEHKGGKPQEPIRDKIIFRNTDNTFIGLLEDISKHTTSTGLVYDEAVIFFSKTEVEDLAFFNKIWDGETYERNRGKSKQIYIDNLKLTAFLMIQNGLFDDFLKSKTGRIVRDSGFLARFLISVPPSNKGTRQIDDSIIPTREKLDAFHDRINYLIEHKSTNLVEPKIITLSLSTEARRGFIECYNNAETLHQNKYVSRNYGDFLDRFMENVGRLSGIWHLFKYGTEQSEISKETVDLAISIMNKYFKALQTADFPSASELTPVDDALKVLKWMLEQRTTYNNVFTKKIFMQNGATERLRKRPVLNPALDILISHGFIERKEIPHPLNKRKTQNHQLTQLLLNQLIYCNGDIFSVLSACRQIISRTENVLMP